MNSILKIGLVAAATAVGTVGLTAPAVAQDYRATTPARIEAIPIQTLTVSTEQLLTGDHYAGPTVIAGSLLVAPGEGPRPLVVFLSGGSGYGSGSYTSWADQFLEMGISVFFLDAFAGRGLVSGELEWEYTILDLYQALGVLADHPRVDSDNIAVMGWSRGATVALYSAMDRFHQLWNTSGVEPVAYIALYPVC
jgi:acetyl esterase/lipase